MSIEELDQGPSEQARAERKHQQRMRRRLGLAVGSGLVVLLVVGIVLGAGHVADNIRTADAGTFGSQLWNNWRHAVLNPWYWLLIAALIPLERLFPAEPGTGILSRGGAQDLVWIFGAPVITLTIVALWSGVVNVMYDEVFHGVSLDLDEWIGVAAAMVVAFLITDFFMWFTHWVRHVVPTFWYFHAVHHAAPQLNALSDNRVHFMEGIIATTIVVLPTRALGLDAAAATAIAIATTYFTAFTHTAMRTNLGPLRYVLVTPQAHRVHHSFAPPHIDKNFGTALSIWDRMFGTYYRGEDEYPATGIPDPNFPLEQSSRPGHLLRVYLQQMAYPFRQVVADIGKYRTTR